MGSCASVHKTSGPAMKLQMSSILPDDKSSSSTKDKEKENEKNPPVESPPIISHSLRYKSQVSPINSVTSYRSYGSKDEIFYDTQAWLDSDCDDDFHSVNGDFTPSRNSTPVHHRTGSSRLSRTFSPQVQRALFDGKPPLHSGSNRSRGGTPHHRSSSASIADQVNGHNSVLEGKSPLNPDSSSATSSKKKKKKKLVDLFRESIRERNGEALAFAIYEDDDHFRSSNSPAFPAKSVNRTPYHVSGTNSVLSSGRTPSTDDYAASDQKDKALKAKAAQCCFPRLASSRSLRSREED